MLRQRLKTERCGFKGVYKAYFLSLHLYWSDKSKIPEKILVNLMTAITAAI